MMKLLTFAHRGEAQAFLKTIPFSPVEFFFDGLLKSERFFLLITGEGPQTSTEKVISVLAVFGEVVDEVINCGIAGSLNSKYKKYDLCWIRTAYAHHAEKLEFKSFSSTKGDVDCITTFARVFDNEEKKKLSHFASLVDRELWAVASAATLFKKPCSSLKIISDEMEEGEVCKLVKDEAHVFSEKLLVEFNNHNTKTKSAPKSEKTSMNFTDDESFYFTTSQVRKLDSLLHSLKLKGKDPEALMKSSVVKDIKLQDKIPKERTRLLLLWLSDELNPMNVKIRSKIAEVLSPLTDANINPQFDQEFENDALVLSARIQSQRDLEKVKNALKIFNYEDFKNIFNGDIE